MQQKTFGKRGVAAHARARAKTSVNRTPLPNITQARFMYQSTSDTGAPQTEAPAMLSSLYIPESEPLSERTSGGGAKKGHEKLIGLVALFAFAGTGLSMCQPSDADREQAAQLAVVNKERGFHCLSGWDGSHIGLVGSVKNYLRDPDSFQHIETVITPVQGGKHTIIMDYRARNGFGGMNAGVAVGVVSNADCRLLEWSNR